MSSPNYGEAYNTSYNKYIYFYPQIYHSQELFQLIQISFFTSFQQKKVIFASNNGILKLKINERGAVSFLVIEAIMSCSNYISFLFL